MDYSDDDLKQPNDMYQLLFQMTYQWPCLSFDVLFDDLGAARTSFPHSCSFVTGTQAEHGEANYLNVTYLSNLHKTIDDENAEEGAELEQPVMKQASFETYSVTNRIRSMRQSPNVVATWSEDHRLSIWDISSSQSLQSNQNISHQMDPMYTADLGCEGFALGWSNAAPGLLAVGTEQSQIQLWSLVEGGFTRQTLFNAHRGSVEDIVFSPYDEPLFASCGTDGNICIWDTRTLPEPVLKIKACKTDINVIDWNPIQMNMLISGSDSGQVSIWDIRSVHSSDSPDPYSMISKVVYHEDPITSIEWDPNDACQFAVSCEDNSVTIWDISVEAEDDDEVEEDVPDQLLFIHYIESPKELHFHPQIPSMIAVTGEIFDVFIPDISGNEEEDAK